MKTATEMLAINLKRLRKDRGFTQASLAEAIDVSVRSYQNYEQTAAFPDDQNLDKLAKELAVTVADLFDGARMPAEALSAQALSGYRQESEIKRKRMDAGAMGASKTARARDSGLTDAELIEVAEHPERFETLAMANTLFAQFLGAPTEARGLALGALFARRQLLEMYGPKPLQAKRSKTR